MTDHQNSSAESAEHSAAVSNVIWRHKKRGTTYQVVTHFAALQCATDQATEDRFDDLNWTIYRSREDGAVYMRLTSEFMDGRFERIGTESTTAAQPAPAWRAVISFALRSARLYIGNDDNPRSRRVLQTIKTAVEALEGCDASQPSPAATVETRLTCANCKSSLDAHDAPMICATCREMGAAPSLIQRTTELLGEADQLIKREGASDDARAVANVLANGIEDLLKAMRGKRYAMPAPLERSSADTGPAAYQFRQRSAVGKGPQSSLPWCDWICIEREDYERYLREPNKLVQVRPLYTVEPQTVQVTDAMCEAAIKAGAAHRIQGFTYKTHHVIRDVWKDGADQTIWKIDKNDADAEDKFYHQTRIESMRTVLEAALALSRPNRGSGK